MSNEGSRQHEIKTRLASLLNPASLPLDDAHRRQKQRSFGHAMLVLSVFVVGAGLYIPLNDGFGRAIFLGGALLYAGSGAWAIDRANRR